MTLNAGAKLGPYEITGPLGSGGMGEVYKARDTRLDRTVAIKVLPAHVAADPDLRARFEREARAVAALQHPHICTLFDVGEARSSQPLASSPEPLAPSLQPPEPIRFLVLEYLEGETLAARLEKGPLPLDQVLQYAIQIADALDKAHRKGITHRDLKPGNVMLTKSGAKLLDFGLAKLHPAATGAVAGMSATPTMSSPLTGQGTLLGTLQYMAPEQLEGGDADARTDIFAFGAVVYEMVTGKKAFEGKSQASVIAAILEHDPPPISTLQPLTPPSLDRLLRKCLAKDPDQRWQTAKDLHDELTWIAEGGAQPGRAAASGASANTRMRAAWAITVAALILVSSALGVALWLKPVPRERVVEFTVPAPENSTFTSMHLAVSPDGSRIVFVAQARLWLRSLDAAPPRVLSGTEGASIPFWSPDGSSIGFAAEGKLKTLDLSTERVRVLCDVSAFRGAAWGPDGTIVFAPNERSGLSRISAAGGALTVLTTLDAARRESAHRFPEFLPDGRHFIFRMESVDSETSGIYVASLDSKERKRVASSDSRASYAAPGYLLYVTDGTLFAQPFNARTLELKGEAVRLATQVAFDRVVASAAFSVSTSGVLTYRRGQQGTTARELLWFDRAGKRFQSVPFPPGSGENIDLSADGGRLALNGLDPQHKSNDIWVVDLSRGTPSRLTFDPANDQAPLWSPDGTRILFFSDRSGPGALYQRASTGAGDDELVLQSESRLYPDGWSPDGRFIAYEKRESDANWDLYLLPMTDGRKPVPLIRTPFSERSAQFSPDGHWIAYTSNETGSDEVYVQSFPLSGTKLRVSTSGGFMPRWRRDGKELFYLSPDKMLTAVEVEGGPSVRVGRPMPLFATGLGIPNPSGQTSSYAVSRDGQRFLISTPVVEMNSAPITVVLNWTAGLKR